VVKEYLIVKCSATGKCPKIDCQRNEQLELFDGTRALITMNH
jgi:hypothetical protein